MKLSRTISYAIQAMVRLAQADEGIPIPCSQLARGDELPERFLLQVLRNLVTHGLLRSTRGVEGGYFLAKSPTHITLCDIVQAFENPLEPKLPEINGCSSVLRERVMTTLRQASQAARRELDKLTLAELMDAEARHDQLEETEVVRSAWKDHRG